MKAVRSLELANSFVTAGPLRIARRSRGESLDTASARVPVAFGARHHALTLRSPLDRHGTSKLSGWGESAVSFPPMPSGERPVSFPVGRAKIRRGPGWVWCDGPHDQLVGLVDLGPAAWCGKAAKGELGSQSPQFEVTVCSFLESVGPVRFVEKAEAHVT